MASTEEKINDLKTVLKAQGVDGNWNASPMMTGLYNGLELALSILEERDPELRNYPGDSTDDEEGCCGCEIETTCPNCGEELIIDTHNKEE